jgi:hypothetical protein
VVKCNLLILFFIWLHVFRQMKPGYLSAAIPAFF